MKFTRLIDKIEKLINSGAQVKPKKLEKLQLMLAQKKSRYQAKLETIQDPKKRQKLELRLNVVTAQLEKANQLSAQE